MKWLSVVVSLLFPCSVAFSQVDCSTFRTGKFQNIENGVVKSEIERTDSTQIESDGDVFVKFKVKWLDNCTYSLTFLSGNEAWKKSVKRPKKNPELIVRIVDIKGDLYQLEARFVDDDKFVYKSTMMKVE
jgi:hypothetical protein